MDLPEWQLIFLHNLTNPAKTADPNHCRKGPTPVSLFIMKTRNQWYTRWTWSVGLAEFIGIGFAGAVAISVNAQVGEPVGLPSKVLVLLIMVAAGSVEGFLIGHFQAQRLRERLPDLSYRRWVTRTIILAAGAWFLGMLPSTWMAGQAAAPTAAATPPDFPMWLSLLGAVVMGALFGAVFGLVQGPLLRPHIGKVAGRWLPANALAWAAGLWWVYLGATWPDGSEPAWQIILSALVSGLLMGLTVGAVTGWYLRHMLNHRNDL